MIGRWIRGVTAPTRARSVTEPAGLEWGALYPSIPGAGLAGPSYAPPRSVAASTSSTILALANPARTGLTIANDGAANLYVAFGPVATLTSWTMKIPAGAVAVIEPERQYVGDVAGVWDAASGSARITEQTG